MFDCPILPFKEYPLLPPPPQLTCTLMDYQNKTVSWCLSREDSSRAQVILWENKGRYYVNRLTGETLNYNPEIKISGGILADEMGLGKTLMILALIIINKCQDGNLLLEKSTQSPYLQDDNPHHRLIPSNSTLIVTPSAILYQWESEIKKHTSQLSVYVFKAGISDLKITDLLKYDIVLTSYDDLRKEFYASLERSDRVLRSKSQSEIRKSVLNGILWWRVVMDEAQMVKSKNSNAAKMAGRIPRVHSWGVSGTPFGKNGFYDLLQLLKFVDQEGLLIESKSWDYLVKNQDLMMDFLRRIMHRNFKDLVRNELILPPQLESKIFTSLSPIEDYYYHELLKKCKQEIKSIDDSRNKDILDGITPKLSVLAPLRSYLLQLRQTCCHPQIGTHNQHVLGSQLRTMRQVLKTLVDQASTKAYMHQRLILINRIELAQAHEFKKNFEHSLSIYDSILKEIELALHDINSELKKELQIKVEQNKIADMDISKEQAMKENIDRITMLKIRLDLWLELKHRVYFFIGACYHTMASYSETSLQPKFPEFAEKEELNYKVATDIRRKILGADEANIKILNEKIYSFADSIASEARGPKNEFAVYLPTEKYTGGIRCATLFEKVRHVSENLNHQWDLLDEWRFSIIESVTKPLEDAQDPEEDVKAPTGDEYDKGLNNQEKLATQIYCYRRLLYDRTVLLTGDRTERGELENANKGSISGRYDNSNFKNDHHFEPLDSKRLQYILGNNEKGLRLLISEMNTFSKRTDVPALESQICLSAYNEFTHRYDLQQKLLRKLEIEMKNISDVLEHRRDYYIRLQKLSDGVFPLDRPLDLDALENSLKDRLNKLQISYTSDMGRKRYLENLLDEDEKEQEDTKDLECGICKTTMEERAILPCGHFFCKECITMWLVRHHKCPLCNQKATVADMSTFLASKYQDKKQPRKKRCTEFDSLLKDLSAINLSESFGTKLDTIVKHIIHLKSIDPLVKVLIFSQWEQVLEIMTKSLDLNRISWIRIEHSSKKRMHKGKSAVEFQNNPNISAFLLNSKSQSSGLTLVAASHVFIIEPVLSGLDKQAINRIHRIGQTKNTFVWRYIMSDTVEERLSDILDSNTGSNLSWLETEGEERDADAILRKTIGL